MSDSEFENDKFAQMNGAKIDDTPYKIEKHIEDVDPEEIITTRQTWQQPWIKALVISSGVFLVVAFIFGMVFKTLNALNTSSAKKPEMAASSHNLDLESTDGENKDQDKTDVALTSQKNELRALNSRSMPESSLVKPKPAPVAQPQSKIATTFIPRVKTIPSAKAIPTPTLHQFSVVAFKPRRSQELVTKAEYHPNPAKTVVSAPSLKPTPVNPMQQWLIASNVGFYGNSGASEKDSAQSSDIKEVQGGSGMVKTPILPNNNVSNASIYVQSQNINSLGINYQGKQVLVGSRTEGKLETPIAWGGTSRAEVYQNYLIRLSKPLKGYDGSIVIPADSYIVARVSNSYDRYVQMVAVSAIINSQGITQEKSIPENAIFILGKNGNILKAESHKPSALRSVLGSSVLSGVAKAAEIQNRPTSQTSVNSIGVSTITINDRKDLAAGFAQGSFDEIVSRMRASNQNELQRIQSEQKVFVVKSGTTVQIFVNRTVSL